MSCRRILSVATLALTLSVAACSSSSDGSRSTTSTTAASGTTSTTSTDKASVSARSKGCDVAVSAAGRSEQSLATGGEDRTFTRYVPKGAKADRAGPLIVDLTAYSPSSMEEDFSGFTKPDAKGAVPADGAGAVVITPEPVNGKGLLTWNITGTTKGWSDDQQFLVDLLDHVEATSCIDTDRVLVTGFAIGAVMASAFTCQHADRVSVLATVSGLWDPPGCTPSRPVPVISFHGDADHFLPYDGGVGDRVGVLSISAETTDGLVPMATRAGAVASSQAWAVHNGCSDASKKSAVVNGWSSESWADCKARVRLVTVEGGSHTWPGSIGMAAYEDLLGPVSSQPDATDQILAFFDQVAPR